MKPEQLKYSILKKAFSGQLVMVDPNSEKPKVKAVELEETPFDIPDNWFWSNLGNCCEMYTGNSISETVKKTKYAGLKEGYDYIATKDVTFEHTIEYDNGVRIPVDDDFRIAYNGSVLMCIEGGSAGRKIGILDRDVCFGNKLCTFNSKEIVNRYIYYYLQSYEFKAFFMDNMSGIIGGVSIKKLKELPIPVPTVSEQKAIVAKIEELLSYVDRYAESYEKLEQFNAKFPEDMKKSILQYAIQGKLVEQRPEEGTAEELLQEVELKYKSAVKEGKLKKIKSFEPIKEDEYPFDIPETWKWVYVNDIAFVTKLAGFEYTKYMAGAITTEGEVPIVRAKNVKPNNFMENEEEFISLELSEQLQRCALDAPCVLMTFIGAGIGEVAVFENKRRNHLAPNVAKIVPHIDMNKYMLYYFMSPTGQQEIFKFMKAVAQPSLSMDTIRQVKIPIPPAAEQKRIVKKVEELLPYCERLNK